MESSDMFKPAPGLELAGEKFVQALLRGDLKAGVHFPA